MGDTQVGLHLLGEEEEEEGLWGGGDQEGTVSGM
jgi:hypothetical protein